MNVLRNRKTHHEQFASVLVVHFGLPVVEFS